jgi:LysR family transcriptional regulator of gallate degradation
MPVTRREIGLTMRSSGEPSPAARKLIDAIRAVVAESMHATTPRRRTHS